MATAYPYQQTVYSPLAEQYGVPYVVYPQQAQGQQVQQQVYRVPDDPRRYAYGQQIYQQPVMPQVQQYDATRDPNNRPAWADYFDADKGQWHFSIDQLYSSYGIPSGGGSSSASSSSSSSSAGANPYPTAPAYDGKGVDWLTWQTMTPPTQGQSAQGMNLYPGPGTGYNPWNNLDAEQMQRSLAYWNSALPWAQYNQNAYQYNKDFGESQRRFDVQFDETKANNLYNQKATAYGVAARGYLPNSRGWVYNG